MILLFNSSSLFTAVASEPIPTLIASSQLEKEDFETASLSWVSPGDQRREELQGKWNLRFGGRNFSEAEDEATHIRMGLFVKGSYGLSSHMSLHADTGVSLVSGREQSRFAPAGEDSSQILVNQFYFNYEPADRLYLRIGALSQGHIGNSNLIDPKMSFPGLMQQVWWSGDAWVSKLTLQQVIPTSKSLDVDRQEKERLPTFYSETFSLLYKTKKWWEIEGSLTHFRFSNLPSVVAAKSGQLGNTINGEYNANSQFLFEFNGLSASGGLCLCGFEAIQYYLGYSYLENLEADRGFSKGETLSLAVGIAGGNVVFKPKFTLIYNESDSSPAYYNDSGRGHNNRQGTESALSLEFTKLNFKLLAKYTSVDTINDDPFQDSLATTYVGLETMHVDF
ncbi:MAG: hypothetical protein KDD61_09580 [Bdellovibrionales bacterium]|nr:hypothetical protein [Bdellovibrionales bacterium]